MPSELMDAKLLLRFYAVADILNLSDHAFIKRANDAQELKPPVELWIVMAPSPGCNGMFEPVYGTSERREALEYASDKAENRPEYGPYTVRKYVLKD